MDKDINQITERIRKMEVIFDRANQVISEFEKAFEDYKNIQSGLQKLEAYYSGALWKEDFASDESGILPPGLKRGVLSEDGIYNLLERKKEIDGELASFIKNNIQ